MKILVTGGAGFIGSALIRQIIGQSNHEVVNLDVLSYAANLASLCEIEQSPRYCFEQADICDSASVKQIFDRHKPDVVIHLAGESHVDRSIETPEIFVKSNVMGTQILLDSALRYWLQFKNKGHHQRHPGFRFIFVSTDEVYGDRTDGERVAEGATYQPSSPYASSKAAATLLLRSYVRTFGLPAITTFSSNNYGPWQYPEKLIPKTITNALNNQDIPIYGNGGNIRDWIYVDDHARALLCVLQTGVCGQEYNISADEEISNLELVRRICDNLDRLRPRANGHRYRELIRFVSDRPGHDQRYGIDASKLRDQLGWQPLQSFEKGIQQTIGWHLQQKPGK